MVRQVEIEARDPANGVLGGVPCLFGTLTSQRYHWDGIILTIAETEGRASKEPAEDYKTFSQSKRRQLVNKYPLFVAWYCAVRLELTLKTLVVPMFGASDYVAVFEWSPTEATTCYMLHASCYMLHATCFRCRHMLHATCHMLQATCYMLDAT